jgi:preflagellin peptidase FlaK
MFTISSYFDLKTRTVNDLIWIIFGLLGLVLTTVSLYPFYEKEVFCYAVFCFVSSCVAILTWFARFFGLADVLGLTTLSIIMPRLGDFSFVPIIVLIMASILSSLCVVIINLSYNVKDALTHNVFSDINETRRRKFMALFLIHKKRRNEKFVFSAITLIDGKYKFFFRHIPDLCEFDETSGYVSVALPMMPFFLVSLSTICIFYLMF